MSSTVKGITQSSITVGFVPRGRRRLKGIADPILVYAVTRDPNARAPRAIPRSAVLVGGVATAVLAISIVIALAGSQLGGFATPTLVGEGESVCATGRHGTPPIGGYATSEFRPSFTFDIADQGWVANRDGADVFGLIRDLAPLGGVQLLRVQEVITSPCVAGGEGASTGSVLADPLGVLEGLDHLTLQDPKATTIGEYQGDQVDVTVSEGALAACGGLVGADVPIFRAGDEVWGASPGERFRLITVDVGDEVVTIALSTDWAETPSVQESEELLAVGQRLLDSVRFCPAADGTDPC